MPETIAAAPFVLLFLPFPRAWKSLNLLRTRDADTWR